MGNLRTIREKMKEELTANSLFEVNVIKDLKVKNSEEATLPLLKKKIYHRLLKKIHHH